jgi:hypothetical protein
MLIALLLAALPVDEIVEKAVAAMARMPSHATCHAESEELRLGKKDAVESSERAAFDTIFSAGKSTNSPPSRRWKDDQPLTAEQVASINGRGATSGDTLDVRMQSPFRTRTHVHFNGLREDTLWGHHAYVLQVAAADKDGSNGTVWVDADNFLELKGELTPQQLPDHADALSWQEQFTRLADGSVVRSLVHIEGRGHFLFFKANMRFTERILGCEI